MYFIEWVEAGKSKSIAEDSWIVRDSIIEELEEKNLNPTWKLI